MQTSIQNQASNTVETVISALPTMTLTTAFAEAQQKPEPSNAKTAHTDATALNVQQQTTAVSKVPAKHILNQLNLLQADADKHKSVVLKGRTGKEALVAKIYAEFFSAQQLNEMQPLVADIEKALKDKKIGFRSNSRVSTKFVRYVFANYGEDDLSDKEAFKYGRGIDVGYSKNTAPTEFTSFVANSGGYSNIEEETVATAGPATTAGSTQGASKLQSLSKRQTVHELEVNDWTDDNENYRVYIAVRNDDDFALLKAVSLSQDGIEKMMQQVEREQKAKDKPDAEAKKQADDAYKRKLEAKLANSETELGNKLCELEAAQSNKSPKEIAEIRADVRCLEGDVKAAKAELKKFKDDKAAT